MGKLRSLIDFLPYYYKDADTYKVDGKGILERFLEICGTYLEDSISKDIEDTLDNIDIDKTPEYFLTYLWEMLGELPFAYPALVDPEKFEQYYKGLDSTMEMEAKKKLWELVNTSPLGMSKENNRNVLKYAITLMKIRGTKKFFETVFKLYGLKCEITDPVESTYKDQFSGVTTDYLMDNDTPKFDHLTTMDSGDRFDKSMGKCTQCLTVDINLEDYGNMQFMGSEGTGVAGSNSILLFGKPTAFVDIVAGANDYNSRNFTSDNYKAFRAFRMVIEKYFDKYLPFNVSIGKLSIGSVELVDEYSIELCNTPGYVLTWVKEYNHYRQPIEYSFDLVKDNPNGNIDTIQKDIDIKSLPREVTIGVKVTCSWPFADCSYLVTRDTNYLDKGILYNQPTHTIKYPGTLYFIVNKDRSKMVSCTFNWYTEGNLEAYINMNSLEIRPFRDSYYDPDAEEEGRYTEYEKDIYHNSKDDWYVGTISINTYLDLISMYKYTGSTNSPYKLSKVPGEVSGNLSSNTICILWPNGVIEERPLSLSLGDFGEHFVDIHINKNVNNKNDIICGKVKIYVKGFPNKYITVYIPKKQRVFDIAMYEVFGRDNIDTQKTTTCLLGDSLYVDITSDDINLDVVDIDNIKLVQTPISENSLILSNHHIFTPTEPGTYTFKGILDYPHLPQSIDIGSFTLKVNKLPLHYTIEVDFTELHLYRDANTKSIIPVKVGVTCKESNLVFTDYRVKCEETQEIKVCDTRRYFTFNKPGTYHIYCMGDISVSKEIQVVDKTNDNI